MADTSALDGDFEARTRIGGIDYYEFEFLNIDMGSGDDLAVIAGTADGTTTTLRTNAGEDTVLVEATAPGATRVQAGDDADLAVARGTDSTLGGIAGAVFLSAGGRGLPNDLLRVFDRGNALPTTGALTDVESSLGGEEDPRPAQPNRARLPLYSFFSRALKKPAKVSLTTPPIAATIWSWEVPS